MRRRTPLSSLLWSRRQDIRCISPACRWITRGVIAAIDPKLDDPAYTSSLAVGTGFTLPAKQKWKWQLNYLDLGVLEKNSDFSEYFGRGQIKGFHDIAKGRPFAKP
jgi:hypothetical protein